jgi:hypothetical protein
MSALVKKLDLITGYFEAGGGDASFAIFIDDWSISKNDIEISLVHRATSLYERIRPLCTDFSEGRLVSIAPLKRLNRDSSKKRFVDVVASTFSRPYLKTNNQRYSREVADFLQDCGNSSYSDATQNSIDIMQAVMKRAPSKG